MRRCDGRYQWEDVNAQALLARCEWASVSGGVNGEASVASVRKAFECGGMKEAINAEVCMGINAEV